MSIHDNLSSRGAPSPDPSEHTDRTSNPSSRRSSLSSSKSDASDSDDSITDVFYSVVEAPEDSVKQSPSDALQKRKFESDLASNPTASKMRRGSLPVILPKLREDTRRGSLPVIQPELREDTRLEIEKQRIQYLIIQISKEKQKILQSIIKLSDPTKEVFSGEEVMEFYHASIDLEKVLYKESSIINERLGLLGQTQFSKEEIENYVRSTVEKEREQAQLRFRLFALQKEEHVQELYLDLKKGGPALFKEWILAVLDIKNPQRVMPYAIAPLALLVKKARDSEEDKKLLKEIIAHTYGRLPHLSLEERTPEEVVQASYAMTALCKAIATASRDLVGDFDTNSPILKDDSPENDKEKFIKQYIDKRKEWENWIKEIWDSVIKDHGKFKLGPTTMKLDIEKEELFLFTNLSYMQLFKNPARTLIVCLPEKIESTGKELPKPLNVEDYAKQVYEQISDHQSDSFNKLSAERIALKKEFDKLHVWVIEKMREGTDIKVLTEIYNSKLLEIQRAMVNNYQRLQHCNPLKKIPLHPNLQELAYHQKKLFQAYVKYAMECFFRDNGDMTSIVKAIEFAQNKGTVREAVELLNIIRKETSDLGIYENYERRGELLQCFRKAEERIDVLKKKEMENWENRLRITKKAFDDKQIDYSLPKSGNLEKETIPQRYKRRDQLDTYIGLFQTSLMTRFKMEMLRSGTIDSAEEKVFTVAQFEKEKLWKRIEDPKKAIERDQEMKGILGGNTKEVGKWIKEGKLDNIDDLVDYALSNATSKEKLDFSRLEEVIQGGVKRALRNWKGKLFRSGRIENIKAMMQHIKERADIEKWKNIEDPRYAKIYDRLVAAIGRGVKEALPDPKEYEKVAERIFS